MTSTMSLFASAVADVTLERIQELLAQELPESLTLEYKEKYSPSLVKSIGAMANTYGGLILIGVKDQPGPDRLAGVPDTAVVQIANACHESLEPPWQPEIIPVPMGTDNFGLHVLVIRVNPSSAPRPLLIGGTAPIRLQGRNATADRGRLAQLFRESPAVPRPAGRRLPAPDLPAQADGSPTADLIIRTGLIIPVDEAATWRPLSDRTVSHLAEALNNSPIQKILLKWTLDMGISGCNPFHRSGFNRARHARLAWQAAVDAEPHHPVEAVAAAQLPSSYGAPSTSLQFSLDVIIRASAYLIAKNPQGVLPRFRLPVPDLYETIDAMISSLTDRGVSTALAGLAGIDPVIMPPPASLDFITGPDVRELLHPGGLTQIPDAGTSHGANLLANPTLDLKDPAERHAQLDDWLQQIALDAGLSGMENLLTAYHHKPN